MNNITEDELARFNSKWDTKGDCKLWNGPLDKDGYGTFYFRKRSRRAHRVAYYMNQGDIPGGMVVDHICRNRHCVAINHLRIVTPRENALINTNSVAAKNALKTHCKNGHIFDRKYNNQRYCSICERAKRKRLRRSWEAAAASVKC